MSECLHSPDCTDTEPCLICYLEDLGLEVTA